MNELTCETVRDALLEGRAPSDPQLLEHAATCAACQALLADRSVVGQRLAAREAAGANGSPAWSEMAALVEREVGWRAWLRSRSTPWRRLAGVAGFLLVTALGFRHLRADFQRVPAVELAGLIVAFVLTGVLALRYALTANGTSRASAARALLAAALGLPVVLSFVRTAVLSPAATTGATFLRQALGCFAYGSLLTAPLAVLLWSMDRGAGSRSQLLLSAAVAGLAANAALTLHCPNGGSAHLLLGHAAIGLAFAAIAWLLHRRTEPTRHA